jgi:hypothetical protein
VAERRRTSPRPIVAIVNHPNYVWTLKAEEIAAIPDARLFEVYNGHRLVNNAGDSVHPGTEQMWDVILTRRHEAGSPPIYGVATDDAHEYRSYSDTISMPGRAWVMVYADRLTPERILAALNEGEFYASTGVTLKALRRDKDAIRIEIMPEANTTYRTQFVGTRRTGQRVGEVLAEVEGPIAHYTFTGDERYVRAKVVSSRLHLDPISKIVLGYQAAWVQPVLP